MKLRIDHLAITVSDLDRSLEFYCRKLGFSLAARWSSRVPDVDGIAFLELAGVRLELIAQKEAMASESGSIGLGLRHICLRTPYLDEEVERLIGSGVRMLRSPQRVDGRMYNELVPHPDYPIEQGLRRALFEDPDGVVIELLEE